MINFTLKIDFSLIVVIRERILRGNLVNALFILARYCHCKKNVYRETCSDSISPQTQYSYPPFSIKEFMMKSGRK
jgi:hypothetical protein